MDFRILGPLQVVDEHRREVLLAGARQRALLEILLLHANEAVSSQRLIDELWGERPPPTAAKSLQGHVLRLRRALGDADGPEPRIVTQAGGYVLRVDPGRLDAERFERLVEEAAQALSDGSPDTAAERSRAALALWRGPPLADLVDDSPARGEIARLEELRVVATELRIEAQMALGRHAQVTGDLEALVRRHPFRERLRGLLMIALYRAGRQADALEAYRDARRTMVEQLGIEPSNELKELERAVLAQDPALAARSPAAARAGIFVGRDLELDAARGAIARMLAGRGGVLLIGGEPGIGKSRLVEEIAVHARRRGARVLIGRCWEAGGAPPYWPWIQSLRDYVRECDARTLRDQLGAGAAHIAQLLPELQELAPTAAPPGMDSPAARFQLFDAVGSFLRRAAARQPLLLGFDDLHAADEPSLLLLRFLSGTLGASRVLLAGAYRNTELGPDAALGEALGELRRDGGFTQLALHAFDAGETTRYVALSAGLESAPRLAAAIQHETGGNPLFVTELLRLLRAEGRLRELTEDSSLAMPEGVADVIDRRLHRLSADCLTTLRVAAVFGREFRVDALEALAEAGDDSVPARLDEAAHARVIEDVPGARGRMRFTHALVRDALYGGLAAPRRARLHRAAGEALERLVMADPGPHLSQLAHHFLEASPAGSARKAIDYARRAAQSAERAFAYEEAYRLYGVALEAGDAGAVGAEERCELMLARARALNRAQGDGAGAREAFLRAAEFARVNGLGEHLARAVIGYSGLYMVTRVAQHPELPELFDGALRALGDANGALRVALLGRLAGAFRHDADRGRREALAREALATARRLDDPWTLADALEGFWFAVRGPDNVAECAAIERELIALARRLDAKQAEAAGHDYAVVTAWQRADASALEAQAAAFCRVCDGLREPGAAWNALTLRGMRALAAGDLAGAEAQFGDALRAGQAAHAWLPGALNKLQRLVLRREQGRLEELEDLLTAGPDDFAYPLAPRCVQAYLHAAGGRLTDAHTALRAALSHDLRSQYLDEGWLFCVSLLAEACELVGDREAAAALYDLLLPYRDQVALARRQAALGAVGRHLGITAALTGRLDEAEDHFERALLIDERMGARPARAHTQAAYARMLLRRRRTGDERHACDLLTAAAATYVALGMDGAARALAGRGVPIGSL